MVLIWSHFSLYNIYFVVILYLLRCAMLHCVVACPFFTSHHNWFNLPYDALTLTSYTLRFSLSISADAIIAIDLPRSMVLVAACNSIIFMPLLSYDESYLSISCLCFCDLIPTVCSPSRDSSLPLLPALISAAHLLPLLLRSNHELSFTSLGFLQIFLCLSLFSIFLHYLALWH